MKHYITHTHTQIKRSTKEKRKPVDNRQHQKSPIQKKLRSPKWKVASHPNVQSGMTSNKHQNKVYEEKNKDKAASIECPS